MSQQDVDTGAIRFQHTHCHRALTLPSYGHVLFSSPFTFSLILPPISLFPCLCFCFKSAQSRLTQRLTLVISFYTVSCLRDSSNLLGVSISRSYSLLSSIPQHGEISATYIFVYLRISKLSLLLSYMNENLERCYCFNFTCIGMCSKRVHDMAHMWR